MLMCGLSYSMIMFFNLCGSFIIEHKMGYSEVVAGYVSLILGFAWMLGGFIGKALINKAFLPKIRIANFLQIGLIGVMIFCLIFSQYHLQSRCLCFCNSRNGRIYFQQLFLVLYRKISKLCGNCGRVDRWNGFHHHFSNQLWSCGCFKT